MREPLAHWPEILHEEPVLQNCIGNLVIWTRARFRPCVTTSRRETGFVHVRLLGILTSSSSFILPIPSFQSLLFEELATFSRRTGIMRLLNSSGLRADILKLFNKTRALSLKLADWYTCSLFNGIFGVDLYLRISLIADWFIWQDRKKMVNFKKFNDKLWFVYAVNRYIVITQKQRKIANRKNCRRSKPNTNCFLT